MASAVLPDSIARRVCDEKLKDLDQRISFSSSTAVILRYGVITRREKENPVV